MVRATPDHDGDVGAGGAAIGDDGAEQEQLGARKL
jgi:hypothetical protein